MMDFVPGKFDAPAGATVADIMLDTPKSPKWSRDYGHRAMAYKQGNTWYALDPYYTGTLQSVPLNNYLSRFQGKQ